MEAALSQGGAFVCERAGEIAGFARVDECGYFDLLYVHPEFLGSRCWAKSGGLHPRLGVEPKPLSPIRRCQCYWPGRSFERVGFHLVESQVVMYRGVSFDQFPHGANCCP